MGLNDENITTPTYYYTETSPSPSSASSPAPSTSRTMFWGLTQRIDGTEKQTRELSIQSERQMQLIKNITNSNSRHGDAMTKLLARIEQYEQTILDLKNTSDTLTVNQRQLNKNQNRLTTKQKHTEQVIQRLEGKIETLNRHVRAIEQREERRNLGHGSDLDEELVEQQGLTDDEEEEDPLMDPQSVIFTDIRGRRRRLCKYCGQNFGASYCIKHERRRVCLRPRRR